MAFNGISLVVLLLACCLVSTIARNLDISHRSYADANREFSYSEEFTTAQRAGLLVSKKQGPISSFAETGHAQEVSLSSVLYPETGHKENPFLHETGHEENIIHDKVMSLPSLPHEEALLPSLSHSEDFLLHPSELVLHYDDTIPSILDQNGLPIGLLPSSVASYSVTDDGEFTVSLQKACYVKFDYEVYYAQTITGRLSYGTITNLSGIQAKEAFFWVPVTGIRADIPSSEYIYFDVGPISKKLSISQFETIPVCKVKAMAFSALV